MSIGDGFNDVNMIQESHVGIGIMGAESAQAAAFADFSIVEFRDLRRLMFWHGRNQGGKSVYLLIGKLFLSFYQVIAVMGFNTVNAMSAVNDMFSLMNALIGVAFVNYLVASWALHNYDID